MIRILILAIGLTALLPNMTEAQVWQNRGWWHPNHASTVTEGRLNGASRLLAAKGYYLQGVGEYLNDYERARRANIDNWAHYVQTRWVIRDQYKERQAAGREDWVTRKMKRLDNLERIHTIRQHEQKLRDRGILPPKKKSGLVVKGEFFESYEDFKKSPEWREIKMEAQLREFDHQKMKRQKELRRQRAVEFGRMWSEMSWVARQSYNQMSPAKKEQYKMEWKHPELKWKRLEKNGNQRLYKITP